MDMYGQRQLTYMMKSNFFEQSLVTSGFSIKEFLKAGQDLSARNIKEQITFETVISRAQAALLFKEYFNQSLSEIKYE